MPTNMPSAEEEIDVDLVRALLCDQFPQLAQLPLALLANGWDNVLMRLGDNLVVRLPRREPAARLLAHEQRWLPLLAPDLPLPIPAPIHIGRPSAAYPWPWSITAYITGEDAAQATQLDTSRAAQER